MRVDPDNFDENPRQERVNVPQVDVQNQMVLTEAETGGDLKFRRTEHGRGSSSSTNNGGGGGDNNSSISINNGEDHHQDSSSREKRKENYDDDEYQLDEAKELIITVDTGSERHNLSVPKNFTIEELEALVAQKYPDTVGENFFQLTLDNVVLEKSDYVSSALYNACTICVKFD